MGLGKGGEIAQEFIENLLRHSPKHAFGGIGTMVLDRAPNCVNRNQALD